MLDTHRVLPGILCLQLIIEAGGVVFEVEEVGGIEEEEVVELINVTVMKLSHLLVSVLHRLSN